MTRIPGQEPSRARAVTERIALTAGVIAFFIAGYFGIGLTRDPARARELATPLDGRIPFVARSIWVYLWMFPAALSPLFLVRCPRLFRRAVLSYVVAIAVSLVFFAVLPVTSARLRVDPATLDVAHPSGWAVSVLYDLDPPYNLFPSLHLSIAALAALAAWKASRRYGAAMLVGVGLVGVSVCTVKQHFVVDALAGIALAAATGAPILGGYRPGEEIPPAYSWRGLVTYLAFLAVAYGGFLAAFLLGS